MATRLEATEKRVIDMMAKNESVRVENQALRRQLETPNSLANPQERRRGLTNASLIGAISNTQPSQ